MHSLSMSYYLLEIMILSVFWCKFIFPHNTTVQDNTCCMRVTYVSVTESVIFIISL